MRTMTTIEIYHPKEFERNSLYDSIVFGISRGLVKPTDEGVDGLYERKWSGDLYQVLSTVSSNAHDNIEAVWKLVEQGGSDCPIPRTVSTPGAIRSFMIGDIVKLGGKAYICADFGWEAL